jgi:dihydrofolate synthase/folylpolyglutamate synthase
VSPAAAPRWTPAQAERHLQSLDLFGMRFGLDRMRRMTTVLGLPQQRFDSIHVVGTNGKSSTARMIAAILERHGVRTGTYLSPHLVSWAERIQVGERDLDADRFAGAVARAAAAAARVNRTLAEGDVVTQFELLTAAALSELAEREVQVAVIEAGLGGRYDATNVIDSRVQVLTGVGLEHTRWLGPTLVDIAGEKLDVVRRGGTLALGARLDREVHALALSIAAARGAQVLDAPADEHVPLRARGVFQRRNFALAHVAAEAYLQGAGIALSDSAVRAAAAATAVPGRFQVIDESPPTVLDGAHNPGGVAALADSLPEFAAGRPLAAVIGILDDKDAATMLRVLLPHCAAAWFTAPPSARALPPATLLSLAHQLGFDAAACEPDPVRALEHARRWAEEQPQAGVVLATGSIYLVAELLRRGAGGPMP